jgi:hypothetical protein
MNVSKAYFMKEMKLTDEQLEKLWEFFNSHVVCKDMEAESPMKSFTIEFQFTTLGTAKIASFDDTTCWIDEDTCNP